MTVWIELETDQYVLRPGSTAIITLSDDPRSYLEWRDDIVIVWNNGNQHAKVVIIEGAPTNTDLQSA